MNIPYHPKMSIIRDMIHTLYDIPECCTGGCCHIVTDDENIRDSDLRFVIDYCKERPGEIDTELSSWICQLMLQLTIEQRALLFVFMDNDVDLDFYCNTGVWNDMVNLFSDEIKELIDGQCEE